MEQWNDGIREYWNGGMMGNTVDILSLPMSLFHFPIFHHSSIPDFYCG
jgi:hypothetical protein